MQVLIQGLTGPGRILSYSDLVRNQVHQLILILMTTQVILQQGSY